MYRWLSETIQVVDGKARTLAQELIAEDRVLVVLDGLDEISFDNQVKALDRLTEAAKEQRHFVVTCRTGDYARLMTQSGGPLKKTPVLALGELPVSKVAQYLRDTFISDEPDRWDEFLTRLETEPDSALAAALSTSLAVWLVVMYFSKLENRPQDLLGIVNEQQITKCLLDGLIDAAYAVKTTNHPAQPDRKLREAEQERLVQFAQFLSSRKDHLRIEWWHLHEIVPRAFIGGTLGTTVGCLLGAGAGLVSAVKFGPLMGLILGITFAFMTGVLIGVTSVRAQDDPRTVNISFRWSFQRFASCLAVGIAVGIAIGFSAYRGGGPAVGLVAAALTGLVCAAAITPAFGLAPGVTAGITGALGIGLAGGLASRSADPVVSGMIAGAASMASAWIFIGLYRPSKSAIAASPENLLREDRNGSIIVGVTAGAAFGIIYGLALGPLIGAVAGVGATISVVLTVSTWGVFNLARVWLAVFRKMPMGVMRFLREAYDRGVLRRTGGAYQFRHELLQEQLTQGASARGAPVAPPPGVPAQRGPLC